MSRINIKAEKLTVADKKTIRNANIDEELHPLELKYGKEPPIEIKPEDRWRWH
ncbi:MAG: hypothetical protein JSW11_20880 [Candidatus Heimdallarchaeota archaeon]|nr:MAG: hypothetical protein JSW11_20880 [Candidatus Heimdallarchaeota archaeon]